MQGRQVAAALAALVLLAGARAQAQTEEQAVVGTVAKLFEGMRTRDTALIRSIMVPGTTFFTAAGPKGLEGPVPVDAFIAAVGKGTGEPWNEQVKDPQVRIDGQLASYWAYYTFSFGTRLMHCGVDAVQLRKGPDGWKIFHLADSRRTEGCTPIAP